MDEILHHLRNPLKDDSPVNTSKQWFPMVLRWCRISSIHSLAQSFECLRSRRAATWGVRLTVCKRSKLEVAENSLCSNTNQNEVSSHVLFIKKMVPSTWGQRIDDWIFGFGPSLRSQGQVEQRLGQGLERLARRALSRAGERARRRFFRHPVP